MENERYMQHKEEWDALFSLGKKRIYHPGEVIYLQGEPNFGMVCIKSGRVKNSVYFSSGKEKTIMIMQAPAISAETSLIDGGESISSAKAMTEVEATIIPPESARTLLKERPQIMWFLLESYAKKMRSAHLQAESVILSTTQKVARMLINFQSYGVFIRGDGKKLTVTHEQLAGFLGIPRSKVTIALNIFEKEKLIEKGRNYIEILDYDKLRAVCE